MNAKLLERLINYRNVYRLDVTRKVLAQKITYQHEVIKRKADADTYIKSIFSAKSCEEVLLTEARVARLYWTIIGKEILRNKVDWTGRKAHRSDVANQLIDIGYHYLAQKVVKMCQKISLPTELGFFHKAQSPKAHPLAYDFMEWLRPITVDRALIKILHKKKKKLGIVDQNTISLFVYEIKKSFSKTYYNRHVGYCVTLEYWLELFLLEFVGAVNRNRPFCPRFPSLRHESRCKKKPPAKASGV